MCLHQEKLEAREARFVNVVSVFTGVGGLDLGLERSGFQTALCLETDAACTAVLKRNRPEWALCSELDVTKVDGARLRSESGLAVGDTALLAGGPPCQPFSKSSYWVNGSAPGFADPRADTLKHYFRMVGELLPAALLLENVSAIGYKNMDNVRRFVRAALLEVNSRHGTSYHAQFLSLNCADYGVPQKRERLFIVAHRDGCQLIAPPPTHSDHTPATSTSTLLPYASAWDAIGDLPTPSNLDRLQLRGKWADLLPSIPEGENYLWHTSKGGGLPIFGWRTRYWSFLLKLSKARPSWTIQAQPGPSTGPFHWSNRRLSVREMCRLQTFPDEYQLDDNYRLATRQIGNAVPPAIAELLGRSMMDQFFHAPTTKQLTLIPTSRGMPPPAERVHSPLKKWRVLHAGCAAPEAHPGVGKGPRALNRAER